MVHFHILLHHLIELEVAHAAADRHAQRVADERHRVMVFQEILVLGKQRALRGSSTSASSLAMPLFLA